MNHSLPRCPRCSASLPAAHLQAGTAPCWVCRTPLQVRVFPALFRSPAAPQGGEQLVADSDAGCFYHPNKRAAVVCDGCGRFLCGLCDVELSDKHYCPPCLESGRKQNRLGQIERSRTLYDNVAIVLALAPVLTGCFLPVTSPIAIGLAIWAWRKPSSILPRTKLRFILAIVFALLTMAGGVFVWYAAINS